MRRDDGVLDGHEVAVAEISRGAVIRLAVAVGRIELDEARAAVAEQIDRQQPHLGLQLLLDFGDHPRPRGRRPFILGSRRLATGAGGEHAVARDRLAELRAHLVADRLDFCVVRRGRDAASMT